MKTIILLAAAVLGACSTPYHPPQFLEANPRFPGLVDLPATPPNLAPRTAAGIEVLTRTLDTAAGTLRFDGLIWSPLTQQLKKQLCYDQSEKSSLCAGAPPFTPTRARLNARLKDYLIDDCVPDALIYQGVSRDAMQQRMRDTILQVLDGGTAADAPLVIVAESMGSKYLFDTLLRMSREHKRDAVRHRQPAATVANAPPAPYPRGSERGVRATGAGRL